MTVTALDHVNMRTARLDEMVAFYRDVIGLDDGDRPDFGFKGAWLWLDGHAAVHLAEHGPGLDADKSPIDHFAFRCKGLKAFTARCREHEVPYYVRIVPAVNIRQVNVFDPDGNKVEMQFRREDGPDADLSPFKMKSPM